MANFSALEWYSYQPSGNGVFHVGSVNTEIYNISQAGNIGTQHPSSQDVKTWVANSGVPGVATLSNYTNGYSMYLATVSQQNITAGGASLGFNVYDGTTKQGSDNQWYFQKFPELDPGVHPNGAICVAYPSQQRTAALCGFVTFRVSGVDGTDIAADPNTAEKYKAMYNIIYGSMSGANWPTWVGNNDSNASADILGTVTGLFGIGCVVAFLEPSQNPSFLVPLA
jgi:hypothetical protein